MGSAIQGGITVRAARISLRQNAVNQRNSALARATQYEANRAWAACRRAQMAPRAPRVGIRVKLDPK